MHAGAVLSEVERAANVGDVLRGQFPGFGFCCFGHGNRGLPLARGAVKKVAWSVLWKIHTFSGQNTAAHFLPSGFAASAFRAVRQQVCHWPGGCQKPCWRSSVAPSTSTIGLWEKYQLYSAPAEHPFDYTLYMQLPSGLLPIAI
jgi:hypothetical protein